MQTERSSLFVKIVLALLATGWLSTAAAQFASVRGTFSAVLGIVDDPLAGDQPDPNDTITLNGEFVIDGMLYEVR